MTHEPISRTFFRRSAPAILLTVLSLGALRGLDTSATDVAPVVVDVQGTPTIVDPANPVSAPQAFAATGTRAISGPTVNTRYGPVQVKATVDGNNKLILTEAIAFPDGDRRSASISQRAIPTLDANASAAGDLTFDGVSGATFTSEGYKASLQAIIDGLGA